jgi:periplasmic divalent cation tolerance protein
VSYVQIQFAIDDVEKADAIVEALLRDHLIACSQRTERILSRYWWKGSLEQAAERLVFLKTRAELASKVIETVLKHHPYETPEIIVLPIVGGALGYLAWIEAATS